MAVDVNNESKSTAVTVTNDAKSGNSLMWDEAVDTSDESEGTWDNPNSPMTSESKSTAVTVTNETKN